MADKVGKIKNGTTVVEQATGKQYFLKQDPKLKDGTSVVFDLEEESEVNVEILQRPPIRPIFMQRAPKECAISAVRMAFATVTGEDLGRDFILQAFTDAGGYDVYLGADVTKIVPVFFAMLKRAFFPRINIFDAKKYTQQSLAPKVSDYRPAIAILKDPNHVVVVDSVVRGDFPVVTIEYRDPERDTIQTFTKTGLGVENETGELGVRATGMFYIIE